MNKLKTLIIILLLNVGLAGFSQRTTIGFLSGINFSDINNSSVSGKWQSMPGPLAGFYLDYKINNFLALSAEVDYLTLYYRYKSYYNPHNYPLEDLNLSSSYRYLPWPSNQKWDFSYLRFPVLFKFYTPTILSFHFSAGMYYAKRLNSYDIPIYSTITVAEPVDSDYGLIFASGVSFTIQDRLKLDFEIRYAAGKETIINQDNGQNGDFEVCFGLGYNLKSKKKKKNFGLSSFTDTLHPKLSVKYTMGPNISQNFGENKNQYDLGIGFSGGLSLIYHANKDISFQTDVLYERKSYRLNDSSSTYFYYKHGEYNTLVDTKTDIDYINIPLIMNVFFDEKLRYYINLGFYGAIRMNARVVGYSYRETRDESQYLSEKIHIYNNIEGEFKNADLGWIVGTGYQVPIFQKYKLDIGFRYNSSFLNIYKNAVNTESIKLRSFCLTAGLIIPII